MWTLNMIVHFHILIEKVLNIEYSDNLIKTSSCINDGTNGIPTLFKKLLLNSQFVIQHFLELQK